MDHEIYMKRCLELALHGSGQVHPNPMVGSVIVHQNVVIGEGFHTSYGQPHAEVNAINSVNDKSLLSSSTIYVSLEPCAHTGNTPPCTSLIISSGIKKVVLATTDPNPLVSGKGISVLQNAGVKVITGVLENEARFLNRRFMTFQTQKRPYVILKWAESANGFLGILEPGKKPLRISNDSSRILAHKWRSEEQGIMVGYNTAVNDNPKLDVRYWKGANPVRILIDSRLKVPSSNMIFKNKGRVFVINSIKEIISDPVSYLKVPKTSGYTQKILNKLFDNQIVSVLVEGGAETLRYFLNDGLWDECRVFRSKNTINGNVAAPAIPSGIPEIFNVAGDRLMVFYNNR